MGWSTWCRSIPITQKPKVASSLGMNLSGAMALTSCSARATSAENTYLHSADINSTCSILCSTYCVISHGLARKTGAGAVPHCGRYGHDNCVCGALSWNFCSPAAKHVGRVLPDAGQLEVLHVGPLVAVLGDDHAVPLLRPHVQALRGAVWVLAQLRGSRV
jgi:hypothetical protein